MSEVGLPVISLCTKLRQHSPQDNKIINYSESDALDSNSTDQFENQTHQRAILMQQSAKPDRNTVLPPLSCCPKDSVT